MKMNQKRLEQVFETVPRFEIRATGEDEAGSAPMVVYVPLRLTLADIERMVHTRVTGQDR